MPKQILYDILKIKTTKIYRTGLVGGKLPTEPRFDLGQYSYQKAVKNKEIVSIGDNLVLRKLRDLQGEKRTPLELYNDIQEVRVQIDKVRTKHTNQRTKKSIKQLKDKLLDMTYLTDFINVKVVNKAHYKHIAEHGFYCNGKHYVRFCCGAGQMRRNTVTFINDEYYDMLNKHLYCGLYGAIDEIVLSKLSAYFALSFSSVLWVRKPRICVIADVETTIPQQNIDYIVKHKDGTKTVEPTTMDVVLNSCDGEGLITPEMAELWSEDMGIGYTACQFVIRTAFVKGNLLTFDFRKYLKERCGVTEIRSIYGELFNVDEIDVLLTESQFKMHDYYSSVREYVYYHDKYGLYWGVARYNKKYDAEYSQLNYQYIQNCGLSDKAIDELIQPTIEWFQKICSGESLYANLYAIGCKHADETWQDMMNSCGSLFTKAIVKNQDLLKDEYIQRKIYHSIKESFKQAKLGRVWARGNYQFQLADPIPLLQQASNMPIQGFVPANCVYTQFWLNRGVSTIDAMRSPMVDRHEHNILTVYDDDECEQWFQYLYSGIVYSIYDTSTIRHSDSDFDGDIAFTTDNQQLIEGAYYKNNVITYSKDKAPKRKPTYANMIACDMDGFDTLVGQITNNSTSLNAMLPLFPADTKPEEHRIILTRLKLLREIIGAEIDKIKLGVSPEFPEEWIKRVKIDLENDSPEVIDAKYKRNSLVITKKPYFMIYLYDNLHKSYTNHMKSFQKICKAKFQIKYNDLKYKPNKTKEERKFVNRVEYFSPVLDSPCIMNKLCHKFERVEDNISFRKIKGENVLMSYGMPPVRYNYDTVYEIYRDYRNNKYLSLVRHLLDNINEDDFHRIISNAKRMFDLEYRGKLDELVTNTYDLFNVLIDFGNKTSGFDEAFIWDMLGEDILSVLPEGRHIAVIEDKSGAEYLGKKYTEVQI